ncbi:Hachiman antiphage defense system protein HamA [Enterobacter cloacae complex sp. 339J8]|uniref:Hachiman antiphage defense system protein HamA n=1 Tax=Enterobacter cloacae complex sp. 339J8 TaxID=3395869 RepID=UPI003CE6C901
MAHSPHLLLHQKTLDSTHSEQDISKGSELAEIFLYGIMRHHFNALPVVPKKIPINKTAKIMQKVLIVYMLSL